MVYDSELSDEAKQIIGEAESASTGRVTDSINENERSNEEIDERDNKFDKRTVVEGIRSKRDSIKEYAIGYLKNITKGEYSEEAYEEVADYYIEETIDDIKKLDMKELSQVSDEIQKFVGDYIVGRKYEKLSNVGRKPVIQRLKKAGSNLSIYVGSYAVGAVAGTSALVAVGSPLSLGVVLALGALGLTVGIQVF